MIKPFGKVGRRGGLPRLLRLTIAIWLTALPAWLLCGLGKSAYPTLAEHPFVTPLFWAFFAFFTWALLRWLVRRPSPRAPGATSRDFLFWSRLLLAALIALPTAWTCAFLYEPAARLANGLFSVGAPREEYALVDRHAHEFVLDSPFWAPGFRWRVAHARLVQEGLAVGALAKLRLRRGGLGALWIETIDYEVFK